MKYRSKKHRSNKHKSKTRKYKTRKYKTRKYKSNRHHKGGELAVKPFEMLGYPHGASSDSEAAMRIGEVKNQEQYEMNKIGGRGGGEPQDTEVQENVTEDVDKNKNKTMEVPQFYPIGGIKTAYTTTSLSADGNLTSLVGEVDSTNDHFATQQAGAGTRKEIKRKKHYKRTRRNKRY
jgi:hypothetical protein